MRLFLGDRRGHTDFGLRYSNGFLKGSYHSYNPEDDIWIFDTKDYRLIKAKASQCKGLFGDGDPNYIYEFSELGIWFFLNTEHVGYYTEWISDILYYVPCEAWRIDGRYIYYGKNNNPSGQFKDGWKKVKTMLIKAKLVGYASLLQKGAMLH